MTRPAIITLRAVIFPDRKTGVWIAQGLEYDICAQAGTLEGVHAAFEKTVSATGLGSVQLGRGPFEGIAPAPKRFWEMYQDAESTLPLRHPKLVPVAGAPPVQVVERIAA